MRALGKIKNKIKKWFLSRRYFDEKVSYLTAELDYIKKNSLNKGDGSRLSVQYSYANLEARSKERNAKVAFVSILPPEDSGIATTTFYSLIESKDGEVDLFSPNLSEEYYFINKHLLENNSKVRLYDLECFRFAHTINNYSSIIIAIGNSNHHFYFWKFLDLISDLGIQGKVILYLHDLFLHNINYDGRRISSPVKYAHEIIELYNLEEESAKELLEFEDKWKLQKKLADLYIAGLRVYQAYGINNFLVNSDNAKKIAIEDLDTSKAPTIYKIFLPVIDSRILVTQKNNLLKKEQDFKYIGTFGVVSNAKCVKELIEAVYKLNKKGIKIKLVIAGWKAHEYMKTVEPILKENIITFDSPSDNDLLCLMSQVDLAIQLRRNNFGESSGIVPMLLDMGTPTIVSKIGSFIEYEDAVLQFDNSDLSNLDKFIYDNLTIENIERLKECMDMYVAEHTPGIYCKDLLRTFC